MNKAKRYSKSVMDFDPWPTGLGFENSADWWSYVQTLDEAARLESLMMVALLSTEVSDLFLKHDSTLFEQFALSEETVRFLTQIDAETLNEFAQQVLLKRLAQDKL